MAMLLTQLLLALHLLQYVSVSAHPLSGSQNLVKREILDVEGPHREHWLKRRSFSGGKDAKDILEESRIAKQAAHVPHSPTSVESNILGSSKPIGHQSPLVLDSHGNPAPETEPHEKASLAGGSTPATSPSHSRSSSSSEEFQTPSSPGKEEKDSKALEVNQDKEGDTKEQSVTKTSSPKNPVEDINSIQRETKEENSTQQGILARIKASKPTTWPKNVWEWLLTRFDRPKSPQVNAGKKVHLDPAKEIHSSGKEIEEGLESSKKNFKASEIQGPKIHEAEGPQGKYVGGDSGHTPKISEDSNAKDTPKTKDNFSTIIKKFLSHIKEKIMNAFNRMNFWKKKTE